MAKENPHDVFVPRLDEFGREIPDSMPVAIPAGFKRPETLAEQVQRLVRVGLSRRAEEQGFETFDESEDFDVEDDDPSSPYETFFDPVLGKDLSPHEFKQNEAIYRDRYLRAQREYFLSLDRAEAVRRAPNRGAGVSPAPSKGPKAPPAEPHKEPDAQ